MPWQRLNDFLRKRGARTKRLLPSLDGIRGLALLLVLLDHFSSGKIFPISGVSFKNCGVDGVYLFFSLSAFLLTTLYWSKPPEELRSGRLWADYFLRRFQRIIPLYALTLLILHFQALPLSNNIASLSWRELLQWLLLRDGRLQFWTIPVEVKYYVLIPILLFVFGYLGRKSFLAGIAGTVVVFFLARFALVPFDRVWSIHENLHLLHYLPIFLLGSLAGVLHKEVIGKGSNPKWRVWLCELIALLCLGLAVQRMSFFPTKWSLPRGQSDIWFFAVVWSAFLFTHLHGMGWVKAVFSWWPMRCFGIMSYSIYLTHKIALTYVIRFYPPHMTPFLVAFSVVTLFGLMFYLLLERPITKFRFSRLLPWLNRREPKMD